MIDENGLPHDVIDLNWRLVGRSEHLESDWHYLDLTEFLRTGVDDPVSHLLSLHEPFAPHPRGGTTHLFFCLSRAGAGLAPACVAMRLPYTSRRITPADKTVPIPKQTALGTRRDALHGRYARGAQMQRRRAPYAEEDL